MLSVIVGSNQYSLDDGSICRLLEHDGWGMSAVRRRSVQGPRQHGDSDVGFALEPRRGVLIFGLEEITLQGMYDRRDDLLRLFMPENAPKLLWELPNGKTRQIDVHYIDDMTLPWKPSRWAAQRVAITLKAPDPTFYDPTEVVVVFGVGGGGLWSFPLGFPAGFSASIINEGQTIAYQGTWHAFPTIILTGPLQNPKIENLTTNEQLELQTNIAAGKSVTIDLTPGAKTITDSDGNNLIGTLSTDSDLSTWHLEAASDGSASKDNQIKVTAGGAVPGQSQVELRYKTRFIGI